MKHLKKHIKLKDLNLKNAGFIVPNSYFKSVEPHVFLKLTNDIPTNYFKDVESKILTKLNIENNSQVKVIKLKTKFLKRLLPLAVAASVILFIGLNFINKSNIVSYGSLNNTNINNYLALEPDYTNSYNLGELLNDDDFTILSDNFTPIEDSKLESYLNQINLDELMTNN